MVAPSGWPIPQSLLGRANQVIVTKLAELPLLYQPGTRFAYGVSTDVLGGLVSTTEDYLRFCLMLLHGGEQSGVRLPGKKTVEYMTADHLGSIPVATPGLGLGLGFTA